MFLLSAVSRVGWSELGWLKVLLMGVLRCGYDGFVRAGVFVC